MKAQIKDVTSKIRELGNDVKATTLVSAMTRDGYSRESVQEAIQSAFDQGLVELGRELTLSVEVEHLEDVA